MTEREAARQDISELIYAESLRLRGLQEIRVNDLRARSASLLTLASAAVVLAASLGESEIPEWMVGTAVALLIAGIFATIKVQWSFGKFIEGPNIETLCAVQYRQAHPPWRVRRDLAWYHYRDYNANEDGPVDRMHFWFAVEIVFIVAATVVILAGIAA